VYIFEADRRSRVTCVFSCRSAWHPLQLPANTKPGVTGQAKVSLIGSDPNPTGGRVVTYDGWALYTHVSGTSVGEVPEPPGSTSGQRVESYGGRWYLMSPEGTAITKKGASSTGVSYPNGVPGA